MWTVDLYGVLFNLDSEIHFIKIWGPHICEY